MPVKQRRKPVDTDKLTKADLQADSFFKRFSDSRLYDARQGSANSISHTNREHRRVFEGLREKEGDWVMNKSNTHAIPDATRDRDGDGLPDFGETQTGSFQ
ncbi:MAG: hypothetical protein ORN51_04265 [Akkermansiaceae bacterium]|nr:hypothetical protein [Akkermansiaceae bacterium]